MRQAFVHNSKWIQQQQPEPGMWQGDMHSPSAKALSTVNGCPKSTANVSSVSFPNCSMTQPPRMSELWSQFTSWIFFTEAFFTRLSKFRVYAACTRTILVASFILVLVAGV